MLEQNKLSSPLVKPVRRLFQFALLIFTFTVAVGILNGLDVIDFERPMLMAHVHAGTLGWITLGIIAACFWMFSEGEELSGWRASAPNWISWLSILSIAGYAYAFYTGDLDLRLAGGSVTLAAILAVYIWVLSQSRHVQITIPRLGMVTAATTLALGAVIGVLMGIFLVGGLPNLPQGIFASHFTFLVVGYLILAGFAFAEWGLRSEHKPWRQDRLGVAQVAFPFIGGLVISVGAFLDNQMVIGMFVPVEFITIIIVLIRLGREVLNAPWVSGGPKRYFAASIIFAILNVAFLSTLVINFISGKYGEDFSQIPLWLLFAMDHAMFIGVLTNGLIALVHISTQARSNFLPWADQVIFWAVNGGMAGFVVGLAQDSAAIKQISSPIMGGGILLAIIVFTARMQLEGGQVSST